jgi:hypothetical protein
MVFIVKRPLALLMLRSAVRRVSKHEGHGLRCVRWVERSETHHRHSESASFVTRARHI